MLAQRWQGSLLIASLLLGTALAWYALGAIRWEVFLRSESSRPARLLRLLLAIVIATGFAGFVVEYANGSALLHG